MNTRACSNCKADAARFVAAVHGRSDWPWIIRTPLAKCVDCSVLAKTDAIVDYWDTSVTMLELSKRLFDISLLRQR
jgi:hypothetical protein